MGNFKQERVPILGSVVVGEHGEYKLGQVIGGGGNGIVYDADVISHDEVLPLSASGYVIKVLNLEKIQRTEDREKRRTRFRKEIAVVQALQEGIAGIIPIYDSSLFCEETIEWYIMPKAEEYNLANRINALEKLRQMRAICEVLSRIHALEFAHRDIKPGNLLLYQKHICITDFGLVWNRNDDSNITGGREPLGPASIRPPEMEVDDERLNISPDYQKSDVYLFAKTLWIVLTKKRYSFRGSYDRADLQIYLNRKYIDLGDTLEPLHLLLEGATKHYCEDRIDIRECLQLIDRQIEIAERTCDGQTVNLFLLSERANEVKRQVEPDISTYTDLDKIECILSKMVGIVELFVNEFGVECCLGKLCGIQKDENDLFVLKVRLLNRVNNRFQTKHIHMLISNVSIGNEGLPQINIIRGIDNGRACGSILKPNQINSISELDVVLDGVYKICTRKLNA